ncbi:hypothetical protein L195_g005150 [Trifolium pratense]|uniref:Uncharacterized protein n=1 Tax=Trifolium pratense TaxID=57577 RepID=A0A2K3P002_TRIPR|nr:hypothetical protein L195_g005150 [Trifolium pratense]
MAGCCHLRQHCWFPDFGTQWRTDRHQGLLAVMLLFCLENGKPVTSLFATIPVTTLDDGCDPPRASTSGTGGSAFASSLLVPGPVCGVVLGIVVVSEGLDTNGSGRLLMTCGSCESISSNILAELDIKKVVVRIRKKK